MVFESVVAEVLNRFLGDYVENLDSKQLKIGIWGGKFSCFAGFFLVKPSEAFPNTVAVHSLYALE